MPTHAEVIAQVLAEQGTPYVFGVPGGEIAAFLEACRHAGIRFLLTGQESSAACMAQTFGQITGVPGVCAATLGPGATNLVTGVANALLDRAPLLAVTAQIPSAAFHTMTHQRIPLPELFAPITKGSVVLGAVDTAEAVARAIKLAAAPRPGPVHLMLPSDVAVQECETSGAPRNCSDMPVMNDALAEAAARVNASQRPLVLIGLGVPPSAAPAVRSLVNRLRAPFLVTPKAKGILPEDAPLFLGVASGMAIDRDILETIRTADVVVGVGFDPVECDKTWFSEAEIVALDSVTMAAGNYRPAEFLGDVGTLAARLATLVEPNPWPESLVAERRRASVREAAASDRALSPLRLIEELRAVFPRDGVVTCDVGAHKLVLGQFWRAYEPGTFLLSNGLSGMGYGVPAAIAAQLAFPDRAVMAAVGDGGMLMMLHDLALIRELELPVITVVFSDRSLSLIRVSQHRQGFAPYGVDFSPPDFAIVAAAFGICGRRAATLEEARTAVEQALTSRTALVLDVPVDYREYYELL